MGRHAIGDARPGCVQFIVDSAFNLEENTITVLGLRGRAEF
jgi:hypothetical protein